MKAELRIRNNYYPITTELPVSLNLVLADIREPDKRNASFTKSIVLNATNEINKLFENIFEVNIKTQTFNPNKKETAYYYYNNIEQFRGNLQLLKISLQPDGNVQYSCNIIGEGGSLFLDLGDKELSDLNFSAYNHDYTRDNQRASWTNTTNGTSYIYPFIDYGTNGGLEKSFGVKDFKPYFFLHEYLKKIIEGTGRTYTSNFINSSLAKRIIIVDNNKGIPLSQSQLDSRQFYVGLASAQVTTGTIGFTKETAPFFDPSNIYNTVNFTATIPENGKYNTVSVQKIKVWWTCTNTAVVRHTGNFTFLFDTRILRSYDGGATFPVHVMNVNNFTIPHTEGLEFPSTNYFVNSGVASGESDLFKNDQIKSTFSHYGHTNSGFFYDSANNPVSPGTVTVNIELQPDDTSFYCLATAKTASEGNPILANNFLPQKIKQKDFFKSIIQAFNLYIDIDKNNPNNLIIEPFSDFYNQGIVDWENRTDLSKEQLINPLAFIEGKKYSFKYKEDKDFYNAKYSDNWKETFGTHSKEIDNDFLKQTKTNEIILSPTPNIANYGLGIATPKIVNGDGVNFNPATPNIRMLYVGGIKTTTNLWNHTELGTDKYGSTYCYAGHTDDPFNPTIDLNFGIPKEVYYSYINTYFTTNNLYNIYHRPLIDNITGRDSKLVTKFLWLTPKDINEFTFRKKYFIDGAYYLVNKIIDFDPTQDKSTKVELIKLIEIASFTPSSIPITATANVDTTTYARMHSSTSFATGSNSVARGSGNIAVGKNIVIPESCKNVIVIGSDNVVIGDGLSNISVINTSNVVITESNYNITNGIVTNDFFRIGTLTTDSETTQKLVFDTPTGTFDVLPGHTYRIDVKLLATNLSTLESKEWVAQGVSKGNNPPVYNSVQEVTSTFSDSGMTLAAFSIVATGTAGDNFLEFRVTGIAATPISWKCQVESVKIG